MTIMEKLAALGLTLPTPPKPLAAYVPAVRSGNLVYVSGQLPFIQGCLEITGRLGDQVDLESGRRAARVAALNGLAAVAGLVDLDRVVRVVKLTGFVAATPDFFDHPQVINGASEFLLQVFGEAGRHARAAVGVAGLPLNSPVEVEMILEVTD